MSQIHYALIEPSAAHKAVDSGADAQLVDVREVSETDAVRVEGALNLPLSRLREHAGALDRSRPIFLLCRSGARAASAATQLHDLGHRDIQVVRGGLDAWVAAGNPVVRGVARVWSMERQVRFAAGLLAAAGAALGCLVHPAFYVLPALVGAGLMFSAATDTCTMALVLARMPWNQGSR
ncbi:MAG: rhodanese-like domain-containing protein [Elusimicrobia bacterium]|nr:rhodanese-like domain-containing protein [Elusimicrobiota bacterium]